MATLLAADPVPGLHHVLIDIFVADLCLVVFDADLVQRLIEAEVGHDRRHDLVVEEFAPLFHIQDVDVEHIVAGDHAALFVHTETPVRVPVIGKADVQAVLHHKLLQMLNMRTAAVRVDVEAVGLGIDHIGLGAQGVKHALRNLPGSTVGTVQAYLDILEAVFAHGD